MKKEISQKEFNLKFNSNFILENKPHVGLCISGGPDSIALLMLMKNLIHRKSGQITVFHFDHKIRKESSVEANFLKKMIKTLGINCIILNWDRKDSVKLNMSNAREARYKKIIDLSKKMKIIHLVTAHHDDDNFETFFMRKKRGSSSLGLSAIPKKKILDNVQIIRPLLKFNKERLVSTCKFYGLSWFNDSSNLNFKFERPRIRDELKKKKKKKLKLLGKEFCKKRVENESLEKKICKFFFLNIKFYEYGAFEVNKKNFLNLNFDLKVEVLKKILTTTAGKIYPPKKKSLRLLIEKISENSGLKVTLHGVIVSTRGNNMFFCREILKSNKTISVSKGNCLIWDHRFLIYSRKQDIQCKNIDSLNWVKLRNKINLQGCKGNFQILRSLPVIKCQNEFLIPFFTESLKLKKLGIECFFKPTIPLTRKNFF